MLGGDPARYSPLLFFPPGRSRINPSFLKARWRFPVFFPLLRDVEYVVIFFFPPPFPLSPFYCRAGNRVRVPRSPAGAPSSYHRPGTDHPSPFSLFPSLVGIGCRAFREGDGNAFNRLLSPGRGGLPPSPSPLRIQFQTSFFFLWVRKRYGTWPPSPFPSRWRGSKQKGCE